MRIATLWKLGRDGQTPVLRDDLPPALMEAEAERVRQYLEGGLVLLAAPALMPDRLDSSRGNAVRVSYSTDGEWIWTSEQAYYLQAHGVPPQADFLKHIRRSGYEPGPVPFHLEARALAWLRGQ